MRVSDRLKGLVSMGVRERGRSYFRYGVVRIQDGNDHHVIAVVRGTKKYQVEIDRAGPAIKSFCSCPFFHDRGEVCKHIWATILAADHAGLLHNGGDVPLYFDGLGRNRRNYQRTGKSPKGNGRPAPYGNALVNGLVRGRKKTRRGRKHKGPGNIPAWKKLLPQMQPRFRDPRQRSGWPHGRDIFYVVDLTAGQKAGKTIVEVECTRRKVKGDWRKPRRDTIFFNQIGGLRDPDRRILSLIRGARATPNGMPGNHHPPDIRGRYALDAPLDEDLMPLMCASGRCLVWREQFEDRLPVLRWDTLPWEFWLVVTREEESRRYRLTGELRRGSDRMPITAPEMVVLNSIVFTQDRAAYFDDRGGRVWLNFFRTTGPIIVPLDHGDQLLAEIFRVGQLPRMDLPEELRFEQVRVPPRVCLKLQPPRKEYSWTAPRVAGELFFDYGGEMVPADPPGNVRYQSEGRRLIIRDPQVEKAANERLTAVGFKPNLQMGRDAQLEILPKDVPETVRILTQEGWQVEASGKLYRPSGKFEMAVSSGIDWFELHGFLDFDGTKVAIPELLAALRRGEDTVPLGDGTFGLLPEGWLQKYGLLAGVGTAHGDHMRYSRAQVGLLDALLAAQPESSCDEVFSRARQELASFAGVKPEEAPPGFVGQLRGYQREGLGWLHFLRHFRFGGCLADDMGLGKTIQVLALLEERRVERAKAKGKDRLGPSLVVVPKSLVFNWKQEAARFTPKIKILDHTGAERERPGEHFDDYDLVITTYGTLRRDVAEFKDVMFDYCILDEAQAIKNPTTESAKAARLLRSTHKLALSGTPIENRLSDIWSLFEFLNPGMLGAATVFQSWSGGAKGADPEGRELLGKALRPFLLRRTKEQVAPDLPPKVEQTIFCELEGAQRKRYDDLRRHYREALLDRIEREGISKSKIEILEALLRLRQAACHPGLIDPKKKDESSAKMDMLLDHLADVTEEGHKALVFSQFTTFLGIVRDRLDAEGIVYEYLDGRTRNRAARVERFQTDADCKLFLISLKAGGLGLNLTAADYVFLLDPWWNPAVEAQAIDRTHRIGQDRHVFAYRLIARDTVEEKVLELQNSKRELAEAIINADNSLIRGLAREDLELLLS
jgi:superfamily II DNA or RNA helicase